MSDSSYDNPAGRLHALLRKLREVGPGPTLLEAWKSVLGASDDEIQRALADVTRLVGSTQEAVEESGSQGNASQVTRYREEWLKAIFPRDRPFSSPVQEVAPSSVALDALASVAEYLHQAAPEAKVLDDDELEGLKSRVAELIEEITASDELSDDIKQLIVARLHGVTRAIDHVAIGGPNAVRLATEAVAGAIDFSDGNTWTSGIGKKVATTLSVLWFAFGAPATVENALPAWDGVIHKLIPASGQVAEAHQPEASKSMIGEASQHDRVASGRSELPGGCEEATPGP